LARLTLARRATFHAIFRSVVPGTVMPLYKFSIHQNCVRRERLGGIDFANDAEALTFGKRVICDLIDRDMGQYADWTMDITNTDSRAMVVPFDTVELGK